MYLSEAERSAEVLRHLQALSDLIPELPPSLVPTASSSVERLSLSSAAGQDLRCTYDQVLSQKDNLIAQVLELNLLSSKARVALDAHNEFLARHKSLLSSHQRLPPETWISIFHYAVADGQAFSKWRGSGFLSASRRIAPLSLSHVCSDWRRICLQTPGLWCSLSLSVEGPLQPSKVKLLHAFLIRSRNEPLFVDLSFMEDMVWENFPLESQTQIIRDIQPLIKQAGRWETAELTLPRALFVPSSGLFPIQSSPRLKSLEISTIEFHSLFDETMVILKEAPHLTSFQVRNVYLLPTVLPNLIPWKSLTFVSIALAQKGALSSMSDQVGAQILALAPTLKTLDFQGGRSMTPTITQTETPHTHLETLTLATRDSASLALFDLPSLEALALRVVTQDLQKGRALREFLQRSPRLKVLTLHECRCLNFAEVFADGTRLELQCIQFIIGSSRTAAFLDSNPGIVPTLFRENIPTLKTIRFVLALESGYDDGHMFMPVLETARQLAFQSIPTGMSATQVWVAATQSLLHEMTLAALVNVEEIGIPNLKIMWLPE
ncbi:hypothetical protein DL96DRAFT_1631386 [Flagelloscypha sp. PMI_526]|nr:hypothetical protein DL96DRAFT_1631386 [Flagelloscypha sp. PMI_526]